MIIMECPNCDSDKTRVLDSRKYAGAVYRKRECKVCHYKFWTEEIELDKNAKVIKTVQCLYRMSSRNNLKSKISQNQI